MSDFLEQANTVEIDHLLVEAEVALGSELSSLRRIAIIVYDRFESIQREYTRLKKAIIEQKVTTLCEYKLFSELEVNILDDDYTEKSTTLLSSIQQKYRECKNVLLIYHEFKVLLNFGVINKNFDSVLHTRKEMNEKMGKFKTVKDLPLIFDLFQTDCRHQTKSIIFNEHNKIHRELNEGSFRNLLLEYIKQNVTGEHSIEESTDLENDNESVDIHCVDSKSHAMIEVKHSLLKKYFDGKNYSINYVCENGFDQLSKYAIHLKRDKRNFDYAYLYVFVARDESEVELQRQVKNYIMNKPLCLELSEIYKSTFFLDLKLWGSKSKISFS